MDFVLAFESTHAALAAQRSFTAAGAAFALIPTPRAISAGCGMSLRFSAEGEDAARAVAGRHVPPEARPLAALYVRDGEERYRAIAW